MTFPCWSRPVTQQIVTAADCAIAADCDTAADCAGARVAHDFLGPLAAGLAPGAKGSGPSSVGSDASISALLTKRAVTGAWRRIPYAALI